MVLVALLSAMNANVYGASCIAYSPVQRGQGPRALARVSGGVPRAAVLVSCVFGFACVVLSYRRPNDVFPWLLNMIGAVIQVVWFFVAISQLRLRRRLEREAPEKLVVRMWAFPALAGMAGIFVLMARQPDTRVQLYSTGAMTLVLAAADHTWQRVRTRR